MRTEEKICQSIQSLMANTGVELQYTADDHTAMDLVGSEAFDLILLDRTLPGVDAL